VSGVAKFIRAMQNTPAHVACGILIGSVLALREGLWVAVVFGTLGGAWGEQLFGRAGVPVGILAAFLIICGVSLGAGGALGGTLAWLAGRIMRPVWRAATHRASRI
jgi:hypothetical protein